MEKKQPKNTLVKIIILMIVCVVVTGGIWYMLLEKDTVETSNQTNVQNEIQEIEQEEVEEVVEVTVYTEEDEITKKLASKIDFPSYTLENLVQAKNINVETIQNELALEMAWGRLEKTYELEYATEEGVAKATYIATSEQMDEMLIDIFGKDFSYTKEGFNALDDENFSGYLNYLDDVAYEENEDRYYVESVFGGGGSTPNIYQEFNSLEVTGNIATLSVKVGFVQPIFPENEDGNLLETYEIYRFYEENEFIGLVYETDVVKYDNDNYIFAQDEHAGAYEALDTYEYTFELNESDNEYYLISFDKK